MLKSQNILITALLKIIFIIYRIASSTLKFTSPFGKKQYYLKEWNGNTKFKKCEQKFGFWFKWTDVYMFVCLSYIFLLLKIYLLHVIYPDYGFCSLYYSQLCSLPSPIWIHCLLVSH